MTLIVSEISKFGIAMVADSAITAVFPNSWTLSSGNSPSPVVRIGVQKIIPIKAVNAAISFWGLGEVGTLGDPDTPIPTDIFLQDFANSVPQGTSIEQVGTKLVDLVNQRIRVGQVRGGFHLAGYDQKNGKRFPVLYHIHTGSISNPTYEPFNLHRDYPFKMLSDQGHCLGDAQAIDQWLEKLNLQRFSLRNGTYDVYAYFMVYLNDLMDRLRHDKKFICPAYAKFKTPLEARVRFLKLQLQTICEFYRLSNHLETIAMPISCITISEKGIETFEPIVV